MKYCNYNHDLWDDYNLFIRLPATVERRSRPFGTIFLDALTIIYVRRNFILLQHARTTVWDLIYGVDSTEIP